MQLPRHWRVVDSGRQGSVSLGSCRLLGQYVCPPQVQLQLWSAAPPLSARHVNKTGLWPFSLACAKKNYFPNMGPASLLIIGPRQKVLLGQDVAIFSQYFRGSHSVNNYFPTIVGVPIFSQSGNKPAQKYICPLLNPGLLKTYYG